MLTFLVLAAFAGACSGGPTAPSPPVPAPSAPAPAPAPVPIPFSLTARWERFDSSFADLDGMVVEVNADASQAVIVSAPVNVYRFQAGDVKWRNVVRVSDSEFNFEDLVRQAGTGAQSYVPGVIRFEANGQELRFSFPTTGTAQRWRKR
jgi:hypothetical protein